ncbi:hypothetical protein ACS0TY_024587 [Phlomoides rotata]
MFGLCKVSGHPSFKSPSQFFLKRNSIVVVSVASYSDVKASMNFSKTPLMVKHMHSKCGDYFGITVAGYPEGHPDVIQDGNVTPEAYQNELAYLKKKVDAEAEVIITQLFYDTDIFLKFVNDCRQIGITRPIVLVSGDTLAKYVGAVDMELWITPSYENPLWSIIVISFISLLAMSVVLDSCFFVRRHQIRRERPSAPHVREFHGISSRLTTMLERSSEFFHAIINYVLKTTMLERSSEFFHAIINSTLPASILG